MRLFLSFSNTVISAKFKLHFENNFPGFSLLFLRFRIFDVVSSFPFLYLLSHGICPGFWLMAPGSSYGGGQLYWEIGSLFLYNQSIIIVCMNTAATGPLKRLFEVDWSMIQFHFVPCSSGNRSGGWPWQKDGGKVLQGRQYHRAEVHCQANCRRTTRIHFVASWGQDAQLRYRTRRNQVLIKVLYFSSNWMCIEQ